MSDSWLETALPREEVRPKAVTRRPSLPFPWVAGGLLLLFLVLPIVALVWKAGGSSGFWSALRQPLVVDALKLTGITSLISLGVALLLGTPLAWVLARKSFPGRHVVEILIDLPLVLPPVVAGVALLMAFGRNGLLGHQLTVLGIELPFSTAAVVMAQLFVSVPFYVRGALLGFRLVPIEIEEAAAIDGASSWSTFRHITLPLALPGIASGAILCWARAVSEFGATLMFAGNIAGRTQTMPLAIMTAMETNLNSALALAVLLVVAAACVLVVSRLFTAERLER
jgi:molybdate transport system permease protein